jgi:hypothetical protein
MFATRRELINSVLANIGLVSGVGVQLFTEPQIEDRINDAYTTLSEKYFWRHLMANTVHELDGETGTITDSVTSIRTIDDIEWVREYPYTKTDTLPFMHGEPWDNQYLRAYDTLSWDNAQYNDKLIVVYPLEATNKIMIRARRYTGPFNLDTSIIPLDEIMLKHFITYQLLNAEGINPAAEQAQFALFEQRYIDLIARNASKSFDVAQYRNSDTFTVAD